MLDVALADTHPGQHKKSVVQFDRLDVLFRKTHHFIAEQEM